MMRKSIYSENERMWEMEIRKRFAEKRMRDTADLRKGIVIWFILGWHLRYIVGRQAYY